MAAAAAPPASPGAASPAATPATELLKPAELEGLVASIALYPDTLLANVLMAATYPLEVVRADRWLKQNSKLKGDDLKAAAEKQSWDSSVKALIATPSVLEAMSPAREPSGIVAIGRRPATKVETMLTPVPGLALVAVDVQDPGNVGAIVRVADAAGATGVITTPGMHGIHHDRRLALMDSNWSSGIAWWDRLHGTYRHDLPAQHSQIGVDDPHAPGDVPLLPALTAPFTHAGGR